MTNCAPFESFYYDVAMFIAYIVAFLSNLLLILFVLFLTLFYTLQAAISQPHVNFTVSFMTYFYLLNMPFDINTWRAVIRLFVNTTQQWAVFRLTKCRDFTLYSMLLFLPLLIVFKEFSDNRELILGNFSFFGQTASFLKQNLSLKMGTILVSLFIRSLLSV